MLRLFLTASSVRRLVRGAKLGMLCLNSSGTTHAHTENKAAQKPDRHSTLRQ